MIRLYASIGLILALAGGGWYVSHVIKQNAALKADLRAANDSLRKMEAHIRQRIDAERQQRATDAESARLAQMARDRIPASVAGLREYVTIRMSADAASDAYRLGGCEETKPIAGIDPARLAAVETACAAIDADRAILAAEVLRLERALNPAE